jgi:hypothetical protein
MKEEREGDFDGSTIAASEPRGIEPAMERS